MIVERGSDDTSKPALNARYLHVHILVSSIPSPPQRMRPTAQAFGYLKRDCAFYVPSLSFSPQQANCALAMSNSDSCEKPLNADHCDASAAGAIKTTESPGMLSASRHLASPVHLSPLTKSISLCFLTVRTRGSWSSSSSSAMYMVSSTSPRTRLQCESYA